MDKLLEHFTTAKDYKVVLEDYAVIMKNDVSFMAHLASLAVDEKLFNDNIATLYRYRETYYSLQDCEKKGSCQHDQAYHGTILKIQGDQIDLAPSLCPLRYKKALHASRFLYKECPESYLQLQINDITPRLAQKDYLQALLAFLNGAKVNIYVSGPYGSGKKYLALATLNKILTKDGNALAAVINFPLFVRTHTTDYFQRKAEVDSALRELINVDYLVLDDFGNEETNKLVRDALLFPLLSERIRQQKPTLFLATLSVDDLHSLYDISHKDLRVKQIISLIKGSIANEVFIDGIKL